MGLGSVWRWRPAVIMSIIRFSRNPRLPQLQPLSARYNLIKPPPKNRVPHPGKVGPLDLQARVVSAAGAAGPVHRHPDVGAPRKTRKGVVLHRRGGLQPQFKYSESERKKRGKNPKVRQSAHNFEQRDVDHATRHCSDGVGGSARRKLGQHNVGGGVPAPRGSASEICRQAGHHRQGAGPRRCRTRSCRCEVGHAIRTQAPISIQQV